MKNQVKNIKSAYVPGKLKLVEPIPPNAVKKGKRKRTPYQLGS
jgi:hypothetical protein